MCACVRDYAQRSQSVQSLGPAIEIPETIRVRMGHLIHAVTLIMLEIYS